MKDRSLRQWAVETMKFVYFFLRFWIIVRLFCGVAEKCLLYLCCVAWGRLVVAEIRQGSSSRVIGYLT